MADERRGCDGLVPMTRGQALVAAWGRGDGWTAKMCRGCSAWHVFRKAGS